MSKKSKFLLVDPSVLPEVFTKVMEVKSILSKDPAIAINEAVKAVGISRSAYYKYKDSVFPFYETSMGRVITLFFVLEDVSGVLSRIINEIAQAQANVLTINQNIPINGLANVTISIETEEMKMEIQDLMDILMNIEGIRRQEILARD